MLFSLSYKTMPNHRDALCNVWNQLRPDGRIVIVDARLPSGAFGRLILPFAIWLMKHTMLGNPLIRPWEEIAELTTDVHTNSQRLGSYYISCGMKLGPLTGKRYTTIGMRLARSRKRLPKARVSSFKSQ